MVTESQEGISTKARSKDGIWMRNFLAIETESQDTRKTLVSLQPSNSEDYEIRQKFTRYFYIIYGTGRLNDFAHSQFQLVRLRLDQQS